MKAPLDILDADLLCSALCSDQGSGGDEITGVSQTSLLADLGQQSKGIRREVDLFLLGTNGEDLTNLVLGVRLGADDDDAVQEIQGKAVRALVIRASDPSVTPVAGHDDDRRELVLERAVDVREAFDVKHVHLVDEQHPGYDLGFAFFLPFPDLRVDLIPYLAPDLARVPGEQSQEALRPRVDDVDLV